MNRFKYLNTMLLVAFLSLSLSSGVMSQEDKPSATKSVLITGASTGIGRHLAEALASKGYHVYAARKDSDLAALNEIKNITAVRLDVTKQEQIDAAVTLVTLRGTGLYALVNNAGIGGVGMVGSTTIEDQRMLFDVNVEGAYRVTKAFMPLIV